VAALAVVEQLQVLKDRVGQLDAGAPAVPVQQLDLHAGPERPGHGIVVAGADAAMEGTSPDALARWLNAHEVNFHPLIEWIRGSPQPAGGIGSPSPERW
jgi:hypothetical protein